LPAALSYYRKAADLGNPHAQFEAAEMLNPSTIIGTTFKATREDAVVADSLYRCAAEQGYGNAISTIGRALLQDGKQDEAIQVFHRGIAKGDVGSASALEDVFAEQQKSSKGTRADAERVSRYEAIRVFLIDHQKTGVTLTEIEKIVPLPPAPLPAWNGTFQWTGDNAKVNANPPDKPSEQLMQQLGRAKHLDPHTGLPLV
ncbi:DUF6396 domain-containing protein, partial [Paraburkholderia aspalathi]|uniref:DUF6396 domain-containing protein n=1 Tax=Paraburkholderia aspalathi TaxID=1324617 RepID=UPI0038BA36D3